jgi:hypothetical protein
MAMLEYEYHYRYDRNDGGFTYNDGIIGKDVVSKKSHFAGQKSLKGFEIQSQIKSEIKSGGFGGKLGRTQKSPKNGQGFVSSNRTAENFDPLYQSESNIAQTMKQDGVQNDNDVNRNSTNLNQHHPSNNQAQATPIQNNNNNNNNTQNSSTISADPSQLPLTKTNPQHQQFNNIRGDIVSHHSLLQQLLILFIYLKQVKIFLAIEKILTLHTPRFPYHVSILCLSHLITWLNRRDVIMMFMSLVNTTQENIYHKCFEYIITCNCPYCRYTKECQLLLIQNQDNPSKDVDHNLNKQIKPDVSDNFYLKVDEDRESPQFLQKSVPNQAISDSKPTSNVGDELYEYNLAGPLLYILPSLNRAKKTTKTGKKAKFRPNPQDSGDNEGNVEYDDYNDDEANPAPISLYLTHPLQLYLYLFYNQEVSLLNFDYPAIDKDLIRPNIDANKGNLAFDTGTADKGGDQNQNQNQNQIYKGPNNTPAARTLNRPDAQRDSRLCSHLPTPSLDTQQTFGLELSIAPWFGLDATSLTKIRQNAFISSLTTMVTDLTYPAANITELTTLDNATMDIALMLSVFVGHVVQQQRYQHQLQVQSQFQQAQQQGSTAQLNPQAQQQGNQNHNVESNRANSQVNTNMNESNSALAGKTQPLNLPTSHQNDNLTNIAANQKDELEVLKQSLYMTTQRLDQQQHYINVLLKQQQDMLMLQQHAQQRGQSYQPM